LDLNGGRVSVKERRSHPRILKGVTVKFGMDNPIHDGTSYDLSPKGMSIITDKVLPAKSNIIINIYVKHSTTENNESWEDITVEGKVIWVLTPPGIFSKMGIKFNNLNEELFRI